MTIKVPISILLMCSFLGMTSCYHDQEKEIRNLNWSYYHGGLANNQNSELDQINLRNIEKVKVSWEYTMRPSNEDRAAKCNPLIIDGIFYTTTASRNIVALNARTGEELWFLNMKHIDPKGKQSSARGLNYWRKNDDKRLLYAYADYLYAIDAESGQLVSDFGKTGRVPLSEGVEYAGSNRVGLTTPGVVYKDLLIIGSSVSEHLPAAPGDIRAYNVVTGEVEWVFHTIPHPGEYGYETWPQNAYKTLGGANSWAGMSLDTTREIVYIPTASPTYDFYGANRHGQNLFANCLLALNANTGERIWHYQIVHHDLWDRDLPCPPNLITVQRDGKQIDAVAQATKQGYIFVFDRDTGDPLFEIVEDSVPASKLEGEQAWPTQPRPVKPPPFSRQKFDEEDITTISREANEYVKQEFRKYERAFFAPPSVQGNIIMPFFNGGANWGGAAYDEGTGLLYINANDIPWLLELVDMEKATSGDQLDGAGLYRHYCSSCHGESREGDHYFPGLQNIQQKYAFDQVIEIIEDGVGLMPALDYLTKEQKSSIASFLLDIDPGNPENVKGSAYYEGASTDSESEANELRYTNHGYQRFLDPQGYPAVKPPWGTLNAIDLSNGTIVWQKVLGEYKALTAKGIKPTGAKNQGGPIVTAGGLIFIGSTEDGMFRAFNKTNGDLLWEHPLPGPGFATPATYMIDGKQYVVIAASTEGETGTLGKVVAFSLPDS